MFTWSRLRWAGALLAVTVLSACVTGFAAWHLLGVGPEIAAPVRQGLPPARQAGAPRPATAPGRMTVLVLGVDERPDDVGRSDTLMVAALHPGGGSLLSIQRDIWTEIPGHGWDKINHAYAFGGPQLAVAAVQQMLDIPIDHYAVVNFAGFRAVVDAVGGIEVDVTEPMHYDDPYDEHGGLHIHFEPGHYRLDGQKALEYARYRSGPDGDIGRMRRQQEVIRLVLEKAMSPAVALRLPQVISALSGVIRTDLSLPGMLQVATAGKELLGRGPVPMALIKGEGTMVGDVFYDLVDLVEARQTAYRMLLGSEPPADFLERARRAQAAQVDALRAAVAEEQPAAPRRGDAGELAAGGIRVARAGATDLPAAGEDGSAAGRPAGPAAAAHGSAAPARTATGAGAAPAPGAAGHGPGPGGQGGQGAPGGHARAPLPSVAVLDYSGKEILSGVVMRLRQARFNVVSLARSSRTLDTSVIIDRSGDPQASARMRQLFPWARLEEAAASGGVQFEVRLGKDAR